MAIVKCGECGMRVSDMSFVCPHCGRDIRALKASGHHCGNCTHEGDSDSGFCNYGPQGYPCLHYEEHDYWLDDD